MIIKEAQTIWLALVLTLPLSVAAQDEYEATPEYEETLYDSGDLISDTEEGSIDTTESYDYESNESEPEGYDDNAYDNLEGSGEPIENDGSMDRDAAGEENLDDNNEHYNDDEYDDAYENEGSAGYDIDI